MQDMNQAIAALALTKHWTLKAENSAKRGRHHSCTIWDGGKRVTAYARTPLAAITAAFTKLRDKAVGTSLRLITDRS